MSEFGSRHEIPGMERESDRERHEKTAKGIVERFVASGYFDQGEGAEVVMPKGKGDDWTVRCDLVTKIESKGSEWEKRFPSDSSDAFGDALADAGYYVEVVPDYAASDAESFHLEYRLYPKPAEELGVAK